MARQVTCVRRRGAHLLPHERISHLGGEGWTVSEQDAITLLHEDLNAFYVETAAGTVYLVLRIEGGREYVTTEDDGLVIASLLMLPECP
jgi:hypothetical protein